MSRSNKRVLWIRVLFALSLLLIPSLVSGAITYSGGLLVISHNGAGNKGYTYDLGFVPQDLYDADVAGGWGVVTKLGDNQFKIDCNVWVGGDSHTTYFKCLKQQILFTGESFQIGGGSMPWQWYAGEVYFGEIIDGEPVNGSVFTFGYTGGAGETLINGRIGNLYLYNSVINTITTVPSKIRPNTNTVIKTDRSIIDGVTNPFYVTESYWKADFYDSVIQNAGQGIYMESSARRICMDGLTFKNCDVGIFNYGMGGVTTILNLATRNTPLLFDIDTSGWTGWLINPDVETWHVNIRYGTTYICRKHTFGLKVIDSNNTAISGAIVGIKDLDDNLVVNMTTESDGRLVDTGTATSGSNTGLIDTGKSWTVNTYRGFLVEITAGKGVGQIRGIEGNTATEIKIGSGALGWWEINPDATSEYEIIPVLDYGYLEYGGGDTFVMQTPHTIEITATDYNDYEAQFEVTEAIDWTIALGPVASEPVTGRRIAHIYAIMLPVLAFVLMLFAFLYDAYIKANKVAGDSSNILPPFLSAFFWFVSAYTCLNIKFIDPSGTNPYYMEPGSTDITLFFTALGVIMILYGMFSVLTIRRAA